VFQYMPPHIKFLMPESVFMKFGIYVTAPKPISTTYFMNLSDQSVPMYMPLSLTGNGSVNALPR
jgi:hypothetical protein